MNTLDVTGISPTFVSNPLPTGFSKAGCNTLYVINMSNFCYKIEFQDANHSTVHVPNNWSRPFRIQAPCDWFIVSAVNNPVNTTLPSFSHIAFESYLPSEDVSHLADTAIPVLPPTQAGTVTVAQVLQNDGNAPGTEFLESTPATSGSCWGFFNDGNNSYIAILIAGVPVKVFQLSNTGNILTLGATGETTEFLSQLLLDDILTILNQITTTTGHDLVLNAPTGQAIQLQLNGVAQNYQNTAGSWVANVALISNLITSVSSPASDLVINVPATNLMKLRNGGVDKISINSTGCTIRMAANGTLAGFATGTVSIAASSAVTVSHGLNTTPQAVLLTTDQATSSGTNSAYSYTSTQFTAFNGAAATLVYRWVAIA